MRKLKFKDFYPKNDLEVIDIIKKYLGSDKKIICANYTKNNFEVLQKYWPLFWSYVKNKTFQINRENYKFFYIFRTIYFYKSGKNILEKADQKFQAYVLM